LLAGTILVFVLLELLRANRFNPSFLFENNSIIKIQRLLFILVSLENIQIDVQDLTRGLDNAKKELVIRQTMMVFLLKIKFIDLLKVF